MVGQPVLYPVEKGGVRDSVTERGLDTVDIAEGVVYSNCSRVTLMTRLWTMSTMERLPGLSIPGQVNILKTILHMFLGGG